MYKFFVSLHAVALGESLAAEMANKRLLSRVCFSVRVEKTLTYEALPTDITFIWSLCAVVYKDVSLHFRSRPEVLVAFQHGAFEGSLSRMD